MSIENINLQECLLFIKNVYICYKVTAQLLDLANRTFMIDSESKPGCISI